ncbi:MAG: DUF5312 domain-containing protein [Treponema sp.]|nr:DUF5312 domain-containing protein [Treponema sp.]
MFFLQAIADFFESIFNKSSPEVQKRIQIKKMEADIRTFQPALYRNGNLLPNFGEAIKILYINSKPLDDLFLSTIGGNDIPRRQRFEAQLVLTGFTIEEQQNVESLLYQNRKTAVQSSDQPENYIFERQHRILDKIIKSLNGDSFKRMDKDITAVHQLADLCKFNFAAILQIFDTNFSTLDLSHEPLYQEVPLARIGNTLEDLYYQTADLNINTAVANAVLGLAQLKNNGALSSQRSKKYIENIKKIAYVLTHILTPDHLLSLIRVYKEDAAYIPKTAEYHESPRQNFANRMQQQFHADEQRIKTETKDLRISSELQKLFNGAPLAILNGYDNNMNDKLQANSALAFSWITPLQILKTFLQLYLSEPIQSLINDIVVEGFFNNSTHKTEFAAIVYAALECPEKIQAFEDSFKHGKQNDVAVLEGYMRDSHKDSDFYEKMETMVGKANNAAQKLVQEETNHLNRLYIELGELLADAKKPASEIISNLKVLMMSSRNRDNTDMLERQYPNWGIFFEIMKNYAIITTIKEINP